MRSSTGDGSEFQDRRRSTPLRIVGLIAACMSPSAGAFDYFEHRYLGNRAYENAAAQLEDLSLVNDLRRVTRDILGFGKSLDAPSTPSGRALAMLPLQFGDLSALAGDFAENERELKRLIGEMLKRGLEAEPGYFDQVFDGLLGEERGAGALIARTRRQWLNACTWLHRSRGGPPGDVKNCLQRLAGDGDFLKPPRSAFGSSGYAPSRVELAEFEAIPDYISLAAENRSHFARHSWKSYSDRHQEALRFASCYGRKSRCEGRDGEILSGQALLAEALLAEAFAQHYLQDSFASGHIGTRFGGCLAGGRLICTPTKRRVKQTHDVLNELGLDVKIPSLPPGLTHPEKGVVEALARGWTAFGDDHLFIREADFHRAAVIFTATESLKEVFEHARGARPPGSCRMCDSRLFPVPAQPGLLSDKTRAILRDETDLRAGTYPRGDLVEFGSGPMSEPRSLDPRIPGIPVEGWKLGIGLVRQFLGGDPVALETGGVLRIDYLRAGDPWFPNSFGFEVLGLPTFRTSYLLTTGYVWPRELSPISVAVRGKYGWRVEDVFTRNNPNAQRVGGVEVVFPSLEFVWELYPPVALFAQADMATFYFPHGNLRTELFYHDEVTITFGLRFDLAGI